MSVSREEEKIFLTAVSDGSEAAFRALMFQYHSKVYFFVIGLGGSREDAEEIVQDVFMKLWTGRDQLPAVQNFQAYLFTITRNHAYTVLRRSVRNALLFQQWKLEQKESSEMAAGQESDTTIYQKLDAIVDRLPKRQREIYLLHRHERLRYAEIADRLHIGLETVKSHLASAVKFIKSQMGSGALFVLLFFLKR